MDHNFDCYHRKQHFFLKNLNKIRYDGIVSLKISWSKFCFETTTMAVTIEKFATIYWSIWKKFAMWIVVHQTKTLVKYKHISTTICRNSLPLPKVLLKITPANLGRFGWNKDLNVCFDVKEFGIVDGWNWTITLL